MTHAEFEMELIEALNMLLEDERASVEMEVALASGATEYGEREMLTSMGSEDIHFCEQLRTEMELAGLPVSPQINGIVFQVIGAERYDDRLRAFAHHQRVVADHARELQESNLEGALREALEGITETHTRHTEWTERRAADFAATRLLDFSGQRNLPVVQEGASSVDTAIADPELAIVTEAPEPEQPTIIPEESQAEASEPATEDENLVATVPVTTEAANEPIVERPTRPRAPRVPRAAASGVTRPMRAKATPAKAPKAPKAPTTPRRTRKAPASDEPTVE